jgi:hypothetical protein
VDEGRGERRGLPDERERVAGVDLDAVVIALVEPHGAPSEDVDGGDDCELLCQRVSMVT